MAIVGYPHAVEESASVDWFVRASLNDLRHQRGILGDMEHDRSFT
jgi:hypothetical protein